MGLREKAVQITSDGTIARTTGKLSSYVTAISSSVSVFGTVACGNAQQAVLHGGIFCRVGSDGLLGKQWHAPEHFALHVGNSADATVIGPQHS